MEGHKSAIFVYTHGVSLNSRSFFIVQRMVVLTRGKHGFSFGRVAHILWGKEFSPSLRGVGTYHQLGSLKWKLMSKISK